MERTNRIDATFVRLQERGRMGLFPYLTAGFPTLDATDRLARCAIRAGADGLELGVPFSDPLADGATLQHASQVAIENGVSLAWTLDLVERLRSEAAIPLILMTYYNPVHRYGLARFVEDAQRSGADGVIVPDLPSTEAEPLRALAEAQGFHLIQMVAPTTTEARLHEVGVTARGFVYCVSLLGTTGARSQLSDRLPQFMQRVRQHVSQPLLIGFGIARPEHISAVRPYAQAVVVASAIADLLRATAPERWESQLATYLSDLRAACA